MLIHTKQPAGLVRVTERIERDHPTVDGAKVLVARAGQTIALATAVRLAIDTDLLEPVGHAGRVGLEALIAGDEPAAAEAKAKAAKRNPDAEPELTFAEWLAQIDGVGLGVATSVADVVDPSSLADTVREEPDAAVGLLTAIDGVGKATAEKIVAAVVDALADAEEPTPDAGDEPAAAEGEQE